MHRCLNSRARSTTLCILAGWSIGLSPAGGPAAALAEPLLQQPGTAQLEEEDLAADSLFDDQTSSTFRLFAEAEALFRSADQPNALPLLDQVIREIEQRIEQGVADDTERDILRRALFYRAEVHFNLGDDQATDQSLSALLTSQPHYQPDPASISPKLLQRFAEVRKRLIGELKLSLTPRDAVLTIDGRSVEMMDGTVPLLAGNRSAQVSRPGYQSQDLQLAVPAGGETSLAIELQRISAVARIFTRPSGAEVILNGQTAGTTSEPAAPAAAESEDPAASFASLIVEGLSIGKHVLEVRKDGYRSRRFELAISELLDYAFEPVELEPMTGTLVLSSVPREARVLIDGQPPRDAPTSAGEIRLTLPPGRHRVTVIRGAAGWFENDLDLEDRQTVALDVRLRPGLSFLGVLGADDLTAQDLRTRLRDLLASLDAWTFLDRSAEGVATVVQAGLDTGRLRRQATDGLQPEDLKPWGVLQQAAELSAPGSVYLLAVLSDDLFAKDADLWFLPAAPGPALPVRRRLALEKPGSFQDLPSYLKPVQAFETATLGIEVIDSLAAEHPVVAFVAPGSPAELAGIGVGEQLVEVGGDTLAAAADLREKLATLQPGARLELRLARGGLLRSVAAELAAIPSVASPSDPRLLFPLAWASLASRVEEGTGELPSWVIRLNEATVLLRGGAWAEAIRALREIRAPAKRGLGQAAVDYWLGVALLAADPVAYLESAREAFSRALALPDTRLYDDLGAAIGPRARGRLAGISSR